LGSGLCGDLIVQKNAIHYHDSNGKYLRCYRPVSARSIAKTMADRILVTLVANDGTATLGHILGIMLEDGGGQRYLVNMLDKNSGEVVQKFVQKEEVLV
jgi:hypothetical protein